MSTFDFVPPPCLVKGDGRGLVPREDRPRLWGIYTAASLVIAVGIMVGLAMMVDFNEVGRELAGANSWLAALGMLAHYATYPVRGMRWRRSLRKVGVKTGNAKFGLVVFFYNFIDNLVPAKLGDLYGAHLARINFGITRSAALGSMVFLRMIDAWILLALAAISSWVVFRRHVPEAFVWAILFGGVLAIGATLLISTFFLLGHRFAGRWPEAIRKRIESFKSGMWPRRSQYAGIIALTALVWFLEASWVLCLVLSFGLHVGPMELLFLTTIPLLATVTPFTPSGAGVVEVAIYGCLRAIGIASPVAVSLTVLNRFIDYWLHILLGLCAWALRAPLGLRTWRDPVP